MNAGVFSLHLWYYDDSKNCTYICHENVNLVLFKNDNNLNT